MSPKTCLLGLSKYSDKQNAKSGRKGGKPYDKEKTVNIVYCSMHSSSYGKRFSICNCE